LLDVATVAATDPPMGTEPVDASGSGASPVVSGSGVENERMGTLAGREKQQDNTNNGEGKGGGR
jgi:hypothetical protein